MGKKKDIAGPVAGTSAWGFGGESDLVDGLFFSEDNYDFVRMKQLSELEPDQIPGHAVLGLAERKFKLKNIRMLQEEQFLLSKAKDRQGIDEYLEVSGAVRRSSAMDEAD